MSPASATDSRALLQTPGTQLCGRKKVSSAASLATVSLFAYSLSGVLYLYMKTIERAHTPKHMWEKVKLSNNYAVALQQVRIRKNCMSCLI